jgi:hypothetical protein
MDGRRGPDYAHNLTARERAMLEKVLRNVATPLDVAPATPPRPGRRTGRRSSRSWLRQPLFAATAAALILFAAGTLHTVADRPPAPVLAPAEQPPQLLHRLADRAASAGLRSAGPYSRQEVIVYGHPAYCSIESVLLWVSAAPVAPWPLPQPAKMSIAGAPVPAAVPARAGCATVRELWATGERREYSTTDLGAQWKKLAFVHQPMRPYVDPRALGGELALARIEATPTAVTAAIDALLPFGPHEPDRAADWWRLWAELVAGPLCPPLLRAAALRAGALRAAATGEVTIAPYDTAGGAVDLRGRLGLTIRVPGRHAAAGTVVELTFDPVRGELAQRVDVFDDGTKRRWEITLYLAEATDGAVDGAAGRSEQPVAPISRTTFPAAGLPPPGTGQARTSSAMRTP